MKSFFKVLFAMVLLAPVAFLLTACNGQFTVKYYIDDTIYKTVTINENEEFEPLAGPEKTGYTFDGWFLTKDDTKAFDFSQINSNINVYAKYTAKTYTITFNSVDGSAVENLTVTFDADYELPQPTKTGYDFDGWYNEETKIEDGKWAIDSDVTLTARWTPKSYLITYIDAGENAQDNPAAYTIESEEITLATPTKTVNDVNYAFVGWFDNQDNAVTTIKKGSTGDMTLTAKWQLIVSTAQDFKNAIAIENETVILGDDIVFETDETQTNFVVASKPVTIDGANHTITFKNTNAFTGRSIGLYLAADVTLKNIKFAHNGALSGTTQFYAISLYTSVKNAVLDNVTVEMPFEDDLGYRTSIFSWTTDAELTIKNSNFHSKYVIGAYYNNNTITIKDSTAACGWSVLQLWGNGNTVNIDNCNLESTNVTTTGGDNDNMYAMFWFKGGLKGHTKYGTNYDNTINVTNSNIKVNGNSNAHQAIAGAFQEIYDSEREEYDADITNVVNLKEGNTVVLNEYGLFEYCDIVVNVTGGTFNVDPTQGNRLWTTRNQGNTYNKTVDVNNYVVEGYTAITDGTNYIVTKVEA